MDTVSPEVRSRTMRAVKKENTSLERKVRSALHRRGLRFRLYGDLPGKPDIVFVRARIAVFIDSCFWHGCPLHMRMPKSNQNYWNRKIARNVSRDAETNLAYRRSGWTLMRFWEHDLKEDLEGCASKIEKTVRQKVKAKQRANV